MRNAILLALLSILLFSCSSVRKSQRSHEVTFDTASTVQVDTATVKTEHTTTETSTQEENNNEVEIIFDTDTTSGRATAEDYGDTGTKGEEPTIYIDTEGNITVKGKIKTVKTKNSGKVATNTTTTTEKTDSTGGSTKKTEEGHRSDVTKETTKQKNRYGWIITLVVLAGVAWLVLFLLKRYRDKKRAILGGGGSSPG